MGKKASKTSIYFRRVLAVSLMLSVVLTAIIMNLFGILMGVEIYGNSSFLVNLFVTLIYIASWTTFLSFAAIKNDNLLVIIGRVWCAVTAAVLLFFSIISIFNVNIPDVVEPVADFFFLLFGVEMFGWQILFKNALPVALISLAISVMLYFVPVFAVKLHERRMIRKKFEQE